MPLILKSFSWLFCTCLLYSRNLRNKRMCLLNIIIMFLLLLYFWRATLTDEMGSHARINPIKYLTELYVVLALALTNFMLLMLRVICVVTAFYIRTFQGRFFFFLNTCNRIVSLFATFSEKIIFPFRAQLLFSTICYSTFKLGRYWVR